LIVFTIKINAQKLTARSGKKLPEIKKKGINIIKYDGSFTKKKLFFILF